MQSARRQLQLVPPHAVRLQQPSALRVGLGCSLSTHQPFGLGQLRNTRSDVMLGCEQECLAFCCAASRTFSAFWRASSRTLSDSFCARLGRPRPSPAPRAECLPRRHKLRYRSFVHLVFFCGRSDRHNALSSNVLPAVAQLRRPSQPLGARGSADGAGDIHHECGPYFEARIHFCEKPMSSARPLRWR